uniref:serine/threonine protein kinase n=1 Tax=Massilia sp. S19_KUP03_FR1 TaxID=3025503 RepID=UPI002FCD9A56
MSLSDDDERTLLVTGRATTGPAPPRAPGGNALPAGARLGEFEITGLLGEGGFGIVYLAWDRSLERQVALKEYMPSSFASRSSTMQVAVTSERDADTFDAGLRSFVNEARILARFDHPALIKVYRFWEANGTAYMVMPYYEGVTLKQALLARTEPVDQAWLTSLLAPLLDTLTLIHAHQCFHRDIAPDNIMMLSASRPLLLDFGAARRAIGGMQQDFTVIFKQNYAPIEQYAEMPGMRQGPWTDLYALASVVHFAIAGAAPPPAVSRLVQDPYVPLASRYADRFSARFLGAIDQALAVRPEQRPQSAAALRTLLGLEDGGTQALALAASSPAPPVTVAASAPPPRRVALFAAGAVTLLAGAG